MRPLAGLFRDPLLHFLVLGGLIVGLYYATGETQASSVERRIEVTDADVEWLATLWERTWQRPPTEAELRAHVESFVREEIFYREAVALGLDRGDEVIRRSLANKVEFLAKDLGARIAPTDDDLRAFLEENASQYQRDAERSFSHVYFNQDRRGAQVDADARAVLAELSAMAEPPIRAPDRGDRFLLDYDLPLLPRREIARQFGGAFADGLFQVEPGSWQGPIVSGYGLHLVRVHEATPARMPELEDVRERVRNDLLEVRREEFVEEFYRQLRDTYEIVYSASSLAGDESGR